MTKSDFYKTLFQKTGKILFAISMADKKIEIDEYETIKKIASSQWDIYELETDQKKILVN